MPISRKIGRGTVISENNVHKSNIMPFLIPILGVCLVALLVYMIWDLAIRPISISTAEGFTDSDNKHKALNKLRKIKNRGAKIRGPNQSKLQTMKRGKYNPNDDLKHYGMDGGMDGGMDASEEEDNGLSSETKIEKVMSKMGSKMGKDVLNEMMSKRASGKRDNFKNVINEVDNINPGAFDLTSIGGTIRRYNENFNNRLNYAKAKNDGNNLEATMAQGKVIFDEFKKIFLFTDMFT